VLEIEVCLDKLINYNQSISRWSIPYIMLEGKRNKKMGPKEKTFKCLKTSLQGAQWEKAIS